jgi:serine/threonine-protein kinase
MAERLLWGAMRARPREVVLQHALGQLLAARGDWAGAVECYAAARALRPDLGEPLADALVNGGRAGEGLALYDRLVAERRDNPWLHVRYGYALLGQGRPKEAEAALREALRLKPDWPEAHYNLGIALGGEGQHKEAEVEYREALRLRPDYPQAHCNLGHTLRSQGQFAEALSSLRRGHELGSRVPGWSYPSADWVRECERLVALDLILPAVLKGQAHPASPAERLDLANLCQQPSKRLYAASARLYGEAFAADRKLAEDLTATNRYDAVCAAALAAAGQGNDAGKLDAEQRSALRQQALGWLRADLDAWGKRLAGARPPQRQAIPQTLRHWQQDPDLTGVRDDKALAALPAQQRDAWKKLWADVADLARKAEGKK